MPEIVLRHPNLPDQPITVQVPASGRLSPEYERAGWQATDEKPEDLNPPATDPDDGAASDLPARGRRNPSTPASEQE